MKREPNNRDAKLKLAECEKLIRRIEFEKAIEVSEPPSAFEDLDIDSIVVDESYDGVRLESEMTQKFIDDMIQRFKNGKKIHRKYAFQIIKAVRDITFAEPTMVEVGVDKGTKLTVCGDTHGKHSHLTVVRRGRSSNLCARTILRPFGDFQTQRLPVRYACLPVQWRLRRSWLVVDRNRIPSVCL